MATFPTRRSRRPDPDDGFVPFDRAADVMGVEESEVVAMAGRGELEHRLVGGELLVRPAVVRKLLVRAN